MRRWIPRLAIVALAVLGSAAEVRGQCAQQLRGGHMWAELIGERTRSELGAAVTPDFRIILVKIDVTIGYYMLRSGGVLVVECSRLGPTFATPA